MANCGDEMKKGVDKARAEYGKAGTPTYPGPDFKNGGPVRAGDKAPQKAHRTHDGK